MTQSARLHLEQPESEQLKLARQVIRQEAAALTALAERLNVSFCGAVETLLSCQGSLIITGSGKAGRIGQKLADTFASTGTPSHFLHPSDAVHGDLGRIGPNDVVLAFSKSGETEEVSQLLPHVAKLNVPLLAITGSRESTLGKAADIVLEMGRLEEACHLNLAPSTSTTAMLALGDALALVVSHQRGFTREDFARLHPGGSLGRSLSNVDEYMRPLDECRLAPEDHTVRQVLIEQGRPGRRVGAVMLTNSEGRLTGFLTDSDIARLLEKGLDTAIDGPARDVMTRHPTTIQAGTKMTEAVKIMQSRLFSELPVVDEAGRPLGLIDRSDLGCFIPNDQPQEFAGPHGVPQTLQLRVDEDRRAG